MQHHGPIGIPEFWPSQLRTPLHAKLYNTIHNFSDRIFREVTKYANVCILDTDSAYLCIS